MVQRACDTYGWASITSSVGDFVSIQACYVTGGALHQLQRGHMRIKNSAISFAPGEGYLAQNVVMLLVDPMVTVHL